MSGSPIRAELLHGDKKRAYTYTCLTPEKPVILVVGGSSGSKIINDTVRSLLPQILKNYQVIHLCGKGNLDPTLHNTEGYVQYEYANAELADFFAVSFTVILFSIQFKKALEKALESSAQASADRSAQA